MTQREHILYWLRQGRDITPKDAYEVYGIMRLAPIIFDLKKEGYNIKTTMIKNENGNEFAQYRLTEIEGKLNL